MQKNNLKLILAGIVLVLIVSVAVFSSTSNGRFVNPALTKEENTPDNSQFMTGSYKNGTYSAVGRYTAPSGQEEVGVKVTLKDGIVADASIEIMTTQPISLKMQEDFAANFKPQVIGKNIDEIMLSKVSGSSLTPNGFNDALEQIKNEAKS